MRVTRSLTHTHTRKTKSNACGICQYCISPTCSTHVVLQSSRRKKKRRKKKGRENIVLIHIRHAHRIPASFGRPNKCTHNNTTHICRKNKTRRMPSQNRLVVVVGGGGGFSQSSMTITIINVQSSTNV